MSRPLRRSFYSRSTEVVARELLGCVVRVRATDGGVATGRIVETEAYLGREDPASHAYRGPTPRSSIMFGPPGRLYVYLSYGMHHCMNFVARPEQDGVAGAVLIRAIEPLSGLTAMARRRRTERQQLLASGPGRLTQALGIDRAWNGASLLRGAITVREGRIVDEQVVRSPRVGIRLAREAPLRFSILGHPGVSRPHPQRDVSKMA